LTTEAARGGGVAAPARGLARAALISAVLALAACGNVREVNRDQQPARSLDEIRADGTLVVATLNSPTTWYVGRDGQPTGPEHDLVEAFAASRGLDTEYVVRDSVSAVFRAVEQSEADLAAAGLTITADRRDRFRFGPAYQAVTQQVVCRRDGRQPESLGDLVGLDLHVIAESSYVEQLEYLRANGYPDLAWETVDAVGTEQLLEAVWKRDIDCTVADSIIVDINRRYYPELVAPLNLSGEQQLGWVLPQPRRDLARAIAHWLREYAHSGELALWRDRYYGFFEVFDYVDTRRFIGRIDDRYRRYEHWFREAAERHGLSHTLLAAVSYQESHWRPDAVSPTGVRGLMMLTRPTAREVGISDRLDPRQSIMGGARYLAQMRERFADEVSEPDRTFLALAAYNIGRGHLHDAQTLARRLGKSPHHWRDMREVLPLLAEPRYYRDLKYGYARGTEPVRYVQHIREYQLILENRLGQ